MTIAFSRVNPSMGFKGMAEELTLSIDVETGEYTCLTRFLPALYNAFGRQKPPLS